MSNSLVKLIDSSLLPAITLIIGKLIGLYLTAYLFSIEIDSIALRESLLKFKFIAENNEVILLNSYSDLFMFLLILIGFSISIIKLLYFHETHIDIKMVAKLAELNMISFVRTSYELYHSGIVWFVFSWLANLIIIINALTGKTYPTIAIIAFIFTVSLSVILFRDLYKEIELTKGKYFKPQTIS